MKKLLLGLGVVVLIGLIGAGVWLMTPSGPDFDADEARRIAENYSVEIVRDEWGVPHVMGETDADAHFGFAYAHAEDDWATIEESLIAARGQMAQFYGGETNAITDYLFDLFRVDAESAQDYPNLPSDIQALQQAYADGINLFGATYPDQITPGLLPVTGQDIHAGVMFGTPLFYRLDGYFSPLFDEDNQPKVSPWEKEASYQMSPVVSGSNGFAVAPNRSADGHTRVIVNSHQPMSGRYAWYEIHLMSDEGLNIFGGTFPGTPIVPQGITPNTAWTHTVNRPDLADIYKLTVDDEEKPTRYELDGEWLEFERSRSDFRVKLFGPFSLPIKRDILWSEHGPVLSTPNGHFAINFAGLGDSKAVEQWFRMAKAQDMQEWREALEINGVLSFNIIYGDRDGNVGAVYNGRIPDRIEGPEWTGILPGDDSSLIWDEYHPFGVLPQIWNPDCGWVFSANATPFRITDPECDAVRSDYSETFGIEDRVTNRARRALALMVPDDSITREELLTYRSDHRYDPEHQLMRMVARLVGEETDDEQIEAAQDVLRNWDGSAAMPNRGTALAVITGMRALGYEYEEELMEPMAALKLTAVELETAFGRIDPEWGEVNRIIRGDENWPLNGAPDVLRAIYSDMDGVTKTGTLNAFAGDTHIMVADWAPDGTLRAESIHQYGSATLDESSPHYDDQVELFAKEEFKTLAMTEDEVRAAAVETYRPGERSPR